MSRLIDTENIRIKPEFMHDVCGMAMIRVEDVVRILNEQPTIQPDNSLQKLADEIAKYKRTMRSSNSDYFTGYMSALSMVEGMIADMMPHEPYEEVTEWV